MNELHPDTPTEPRYRQRRPPDWPTDRTGLKRWLGILIAFGVVGLHILLLVALYETDWHEDRVFYPLIHAQGLVFQIILGGVDVIAIVLGAMWFAPKRSDYRILIVFVVYCILLVPVCFYVPIAFIVSDRTPADSITVDEHTYRLIIETDYGHLGDPSYDTFVVYRCDRISFFCQSTYVERIEEPFYDTSPALVALETGDIHLKRDADGSLYIHYHNDRFPISPDD